MENTPQSFIDENHRISIIYEDNHLLVLNKPAGLLTQPSGTENESLESLAKSWIKDKLQKPGNVFLHALHRIDKPVSGIVLFARTSKALSRLNEALREKESKKSYYALVEGTPLHSTGELAHYLVHDDFHARIVKKETPNAKLAILTYRVVKTKDGISMLEIELKTGRYHQIRAQCAFIGCPIVGDEKYGSRRKLSFGTIALHHHCLEITHPISSERLSFSAPIPTSWSYLI